MQSQKFIVQIKLRRETRDYLFRLRQYRSDRRGNIETLDDVVQRLLDLQGDKDDYPDVAAEALFRGHLKEESG